jgi:hypothetical protein
VHVVEGLGDHGARDRYHHGLSLRDVTAFLSDPLQFVACLPLLPSCYSR